MNLQIEKALKNRGVFRIRTLSKGGGGAGLSYSNFYQSFWADCWIQTSKKILRILKSAENCTTSRTRTAPSSKLWYSGKVKQNVLIEICRADHKKRLWRRQCRIFYLFFLTAIIIPRSPTAHSSVPHSSLTVSTFNTSVNIAIKNNHYGDQHFTFKSLYSKCSKSSLRPHRLLVARWQNLRVRRVRHWLFIN